MAQATRLSLCCKRINFQLQRLFIWKSEVKVLIVWLTFLIGSFIHDFFPLPRSYLSYKRNVFNVYFAKKGWGWTLMLVLGFNILILIRHGKYDPRLTFRTLSRGLHATLAWFCLTSTFVFFEEVTGICEGNSTKKTKQSCIYGGLNWNGFDISGHCFLLSFCILIINEELFPFVQKAKLQNKDSNVADVPPDTFSIKSTLLDIFSLSLTMLMVLWEFLMFFTCIYYHTLFQKFLGIAFGISAWYAIYFLLPQTKYNLAPLKPLYLDSLS